MNQEALDSVNGRILAITLVLNSLIPQLTPAQARNAADALAGEHEEVARHDVEDDVPQVEAHQRDMLVVEWARLLQAVGSRAE
jgi:hypothetical protein